MVKKLLVILVLLLFTVKLNAQIDNQFWFVAPNVSSQHGDNPIFIRLSSMNDPVNFQLTMPADPSFVPITGSIGPNATFSIPLTAFKAQIENSPSDQVNTKGLFLTTDNLVTAYYEVAHTNNPAIYSFKGQNGLGTEFYIVSQNVFPNKNTVTDAYETFEIVATEDNTTITITPTDDLLATHLPNVPFNIVLNSGETYSARSIHQGANYTLAGSHIVSDKPIAVTWMDDSIVTGGWDEVGDQIVPVSIIGTEYIAIKGYANNSASDNEEHVFIVGTTNSTGLTIDGTFIQNINAGELYDHPIPTGSATAYIQTTAPAYVMHLSGFPGECGASLLPQIFCTGSRQIGFYRTGTGNFSLMILTLAGNEGAFLMDGSATVIQATDFLLVPGTGGLWVYCRKALTTALLPLGSHLLTNSLGKFHLGIINMLGGSAEYGYFSYFSSINIGVDQTLCPGTTTTLNGGEDWTTYLWEVEIAGVWTPTGGNTQYLVVSTAGHYRCSVTGQNCALQDDVNIYYSPVFEPDITGPATLCGPTPNITYTATSNFSPYAWSLTGGTVTSGQGTPSITVDWTFSGNHTITLNCTNSYGCAVQKTYPVTVYPANVVTLNPYSPTCSNIPPFLLTGGSPAGGVYSGTGVLPGDIFDPSSGNGDHTITYTFTDANNCTASDSKTLTVNPAPVVALAPFSPVCNSLPPFPLTGGTPAGGLYSGTGVLPGNIFDPSSGDGPHPITYTYNDANGCIASDQKILEVNPTPVATLAPFAPVCNSVPQFLLTGGTPLGGTYSGTGVLPGNIFDPASGDGPHPITYTVTNIFNCSASDTKTLTVNPTPVVTLSALAPVCISLPPYVLTGGAPAGGQYSGTGVDTPTGIFSPLLAPAGSQITYTVTNSFNCTSFSQQFQQVIPMPTSQGTVTGDTPVCQGDMGSSYTLLNPDPLATSFIWSLTPVSAGTVTGTGPACTVDWSPAYSGNVLLRFQAVSGCGASNLSPGLTILVKPVPVVTLTACNDLKTTKNGKPIVLKGGQPLGIMGIYEGTGVHESPAGSGRFVFDPADIMVFPMASGNPYTITYRYTNSLGCDASATEDIRVYPSNANQPCQVSPLSDVRDAQSYPTFRSGSGANQNCWMAKNLNYGTAISGATVQTDNCTFEKYCQNDVFGQCNQNGGLYQWNELMHYGAAEGDQGLCPPGWHVATKTEWDLLITDNQDVGQAGSYLKDMATASGFHGITGGLLYLNQTWSFTGGAITGSMFWTSHPVTSVTARANGINSFNPSVSSYNSNTANAFSVRCVKD